MAQFYRGKDKAEINYICFDKLSNFLAVTSDRGTIHKWSLGGVIEKLKEIVEQAMNNVYKLKVPLLVSSSYGNSWYEAK